MCWRLDLHHNLYSVLLAGSCFPVFLREINGGGRHRLHCTTQLGHSSQGFRSASATAHQRCQSASELANAEVTDAGVSSVWKYPFSSNGWPLAVLRTAPYSRRRSACPTMRSW